MKVKTIYYKKLFNLGNYEHEEIGIELEIDKGEKAMDVLAEAKRFVNSKGDPTIAKRIVADPDSFKYNEVKWAEEFLDKYDPNKEMPF